MKDLRYLPDTATLELDVKSCAGCGLCITVCPHQVFEMHEKKARITDLNGCMECGACALNCPSGAISVTPGVGCAEYIISSWLHGKEKASCGNCC